ncbi:MAG: DUF3842 family protein [Eubacteriaceae bacterium]|jgi:hypothetical protein|nr:DUF3842 family protein [Eubacteriaceae bacterium]
MKILIIDGQGGNIGRSLAEKITAAFPGEEITAVGTNSAATANMLKASGIRAATGENALKVACKKAGVIIGPIGIIAADSLMGEVTAEMAAAVGSSDAVKILIPMAQCGIFVAGVREAGASKLIEDALEILRTVIDASQKGIIS